MLELNEVLSSFANAVLGLGLGASLASYFLERRKVIKLQKELNELRYQSFLNMYAKQINVIPKRGRGRPRKNKVEV